MSEPSLHARPHGTRREIKFVADSSALDRLLMWLRLHPAGFVRAFSPRWVNSLYFDTFDYAAFSENLTGGSERVKVRYRWYGESPDPDAGHLEVKAKRNVFGWKLRYDVPRAPTEAGSTWREIVRELRAQLPDEGRLWLDANAMPVLTNRYFRRYLVSADGTARITVDTNHAVWDQRVRPAPNQDRRARLPDSMVVEVKFEPRHRDRASRWLAGIPIRVSRHSKYIHGVAAIAGR